MGLFRNRARRNREKAAAKPVDEQPEVDAAQEQIVQQDLGTEVRPNPDQPGWGRIVGQTISKARESR